MVQCQGHVREIALMTQRRMPKATVGQTINMHHEVPPADAHNSQAIMQWYTRTCHPQCGQQRMRCSAQSQPQRKADQGVSMLRALPSVSRGVLRSWNVSSGLGPHCSVQ